MATTHTWQWGRFTGVTTCQRCGLLPQDDDLEFDCVETCEVCGRTQTATEYCIVDGDYHVIYESDFTPTRTIIGN